MKRISFNVRCAIVACLLAISTLFSPVVNASIGGSNWPQWRGPASQGVSEEKNLPTEWSSTKNIQWKTPIPGHGHSSPIVWGNKIFLTTSIEGPVVPDAKPFKHMIGKEEFKHPDWAGSDRSEEHTSELQSRVDISYAVF